MEYDMEGLSFLPRRKKKWKDFFFTNYHKHVLDTTPS